MEKVSKTKSFLLALIIIVGLVFLNFPNISSKTKNFFYSISSPIQKKFNQTAIRIKNSWGILNSLRNISKENILLEERIKELLAQNTKLKELEKENQFLRFYLKLPNSQKYQIDLANIISRDFQGLEKYILIDKGKLAGIEKNMSIVAFENILIGKVVEIFDNFSKILLITSTNSKIPAIIQESRIEGLIRGSGENLLLMDMIPKDVKVEKDQIVITSGIEGIFPKGLLIGKVSTVEFSDNEMFLKVEVVTTIEMNKLERVFIIKSK